MTKLQRTLREQELVKLERAQAKALKEAQKAQAESVAKAKENPEELLAYLFGGGK